jgi:hypothetical protein
MKKKLTLIIASLLAAATAGFAQDAPKPDAPRPERPAGDRPRFVPPIMVALDTDKDGELSADEIAAAATTLLTLDKNKDGKISAEEMRPEGGRFGGPRPDGAARPEGTPRRQRPESAGGGEKPAGK